MSGEVAEKWGHKSEAGSKLLGASTEPHMGLELTNCEIMTWAKVGCSIDWATQVPLEWFFLRNHLSWQKYFKDNKTNVIIEGYKNSHDFHSHGSRISNQTFDIQVLCFCHHTRLPPCLAYNVQGHCSEKHVYSSWQTIYMGLVSQSSLSRPFSVRRARITSWFTVYNLCLSDVFLLFFIINKWV